MRNGRRNRSADRISFTGLLDCRNPHIGMCRKLPVGALGVAEGCLDAPTERQPALLRNHTSSILSGCRTYDVMSIESISDFHLEPFHKSLHFDTVNVPIRICLAAPIREAVPFPESHRANDRSATT